MPSRLATGPSLKMPVCCKSDCWGKTKMFAQKNEPQQVTTGRFEIEQDGHVAYLEYTVAGKVLTLVHTEVPEELRGKGLASELATSALQWARDNHMKVDVICPLVANYLERHKEYSDLVMK
jgi:uncharacterized protein